MGFTPSKYQQDIFDFIQHGNGNAVISALAGSGKTFTLVNSMKLIPKKEKCLFIAFNKSIVEELTEKLKDRPNCTIRTVHSLGLSFLQNNLDVHIDVDEYKYNSFLRANIGRLSSIENINELPKDELNEYLGRIISIINFSRLNLAQSVNEIRSVASNYSIPIENDEDDVAFKCLKWGKENVTTIDYTDMVWLPFELSLKPVANKYDWIFFDECQDASVAGIKLFLRCFKRGTRFVAAGDRNQCINMFAGASEEAFDFMCNYQNTTVFPLPISYRCDRKIIEMAQDIVPDIMHRDDADEGIVVTDCFTSSIKDGDMVLSRTKSPLFRLYTKLLRRGRKCFIKGQDGVDGLIELLNLSEQEELNPELDKAGVFSELYEHMFKERNKLLTKRGITIEDATVSPYIMNIYDSISALIILGDLCHNSREELRELLDKIQNSEPEGICLSTIHKAKGLEADNVYILCRSSMPMSKAKKDWEKIEETNLIYVAYTRAKHKLGFISETEIPPSGALKETNSIIEDVASIEGRLEALLGYEVTEHVSEEELSRFRIKGATKIEPLHKDDNTIIVMNSSTIISGEDDLLKELEGLI